LALELRKTLEQLWFCKLQVETIQVQNIIQLRITIWA